jgi:diadenosine tetraphosphate (Ap4A) HIT family hydrolase
MNITPAMLVDSGIYPTCYDREHAHALYGDCSDKLLFENELFECMLVGNPRAAGHTAIISKTHYKDMLEIPDALCREIFVFAKKAMNALRAVYGAESVYLCTMCDGPMNHFHLQLIPRYAYEKRGSRNFVKERQAYVADAEKVNTLRKLLGS